MTEVFYFRYHDLDSGEVLFESTTYKFIGRFKNSFNLPNWLETVKDQPTFEDLLTRFYGTLSSRTTKS